MTATGKLFLIGAGPGDPELLTLKAVRALREADVILYDRLVSPECLAHARSEAEIIYVGKHHGEQERTQEEIFTLIRTHAQAGRTVARLKGGDPMVFGRGAEEWALALAHGIAVEVIPGVSSAIAVPTHAGIPVTFRRVSQSFVVVTGHEHAGDEQRWAAFRDVGTIVILMGVKNRVAIAAGLMAAGRSSEEPVAFIEHGTVPEERVVESSLGAVAAGLVHVRSPAVFVIGEVVRLRARLKPG